MRLFSRTGAVAVDDAGAHYEPDDDGGFVFPPELGERMHAAHFGGEPLWETDIERQRRMIALEAARRADPATLLAAVEKLVQQAEADTVPAAKPAPKSAAKAAK